jgi:hypothetical protein
VNSEFEKKKKYWLKVDRENKIYQSNKCFAFGGTLILLFSYELVKLCQNYSTFRDFKVAARSVEKTSFLICFILILVGVIFIILGVKIRKSPLSDRPRELP